MGRRAGNGNRRGGGGPARPGAGDEPAGAGRRGRADAALQAPGAAPASRANAAHPARGRTRPAAGADPAEVTARRLEHARRAAAQFGACVLLKGSTTVVAPPHDVDPVLINTTGTSWLATAGTGDVLAGLAGALLAQGLAAPQAALCAAYLHGLAARLAAAGGHRGGEGGYGGGWESGYWGGDAPIGASDVVAAL